MAHIKEYNPEAPRLQRVIPGCERSERTRIHNPQHSIAGTGVMDSGFALMRAPE
jgi:hypothetical protein